MIITKNELIEKIKGAEHDLVIGDFNLIKKDFFETDKLFLGSLLIPDTSKNDTGFGWQKTEKKYIFECDGDNYIELFSGTSVSKISFERFYELDSIRVGEVVPYNKYFNLGVSVEVLESNLAMFENFSDIQIDIAINRLNKIKSRKREIGR